MCIISWKVKEKKTFHVEPEILHQYKGNVWVFLKCKDRSLSIYLEIVQKIICNNPNANNLKDNLIKPLRRLREQWIKFKAR